MKILATVSAVIGIVLLILGVAIKIKVSPALNFLQFNQAISYFTVGNTFLILALVANSLFKK